MNDQSPFEETKTSVAHETTAPDIPFPPAIYPALAIGGGYFLQRFTAIPAPSHQSFEILGWVTCLVGMVIIVWALATLKKSNTTAIPHRAANHLVITGPYRYSRNPIYIGFLLLTLASAMATGNLWILLMTPIAMGLMTLYAINPEEKYLSEAFGEKYQTYCRKVRRWL